MMNLKQLQREAHAVAREKGWWDSPRSFGDLIALVHSELSEALEAYRELGLDNRYRTTFRTGASAESVHVQDDANWKPVGVPSELADVVVRVADTAEFYRWQLDALELPEEWNETPDTFGEWITAGHRWLSHASMRIAGDTPLHLAQLVRHVQRMAEHYGIDLDAAIEAKMSYNRTRSYRDE